MKRLISQDKSFVQKEAEMKYYTKSEEEVLKEIGGRDYIKMNIMFKKAIDVLKTTDK